MSRQRACKEALSSSTSGWTPEELASNINLNNKYIPRFSTATGRRETNEDAHSCFTFKDMAVYGIFDGHNGSEISRFCASNLQYFFVKCYSPQQTLQEILREVVRRLNM